MAVVEKPAVKRAVETVAAIVAAENSVEKVADMSVENYSILGYYSNFGSKVHYSSFGYYFGFHSSYYYFFGFVHYYSNFLDSDYYWLLVDTFEIHGHIVGMYDIGLLSNL